MYALALQVLVLVATAPESGQAQHEVVAVTDLQVSDLEGFGQADRRRFTDLLDAVASGAGLRTVPRSELAAQLAAQQAESYRDCYDEACQIELGKRVAAQKILTSTWMKLGGSCVLAIRLYDLRSGLAEFSTTADGSCDHAGLRAAIDTVRTALRARRQVGYGAFSLDLQDGKAISNPPTDRSAYLRIRAEAKGEPALGIEVYINGELAGIIAAGLFTKELPLGRYVVILRTVGDMFEHRRFDLEMTGDSVRIPAEGVVELLPTFGNIEITGAPENVTVVIDGLPTRIQGRFVGAYGIGRHTVLIEAPGYLPHGPAEVLVRGGEVSRVAYRLTRNAGSAVITGTPVGANITINGHPAGRLPLRLAEVEVGEHVVEVSAPGHQMRREMLNIHRGAESRLSVQLQPKLARLKVESLASILGSAQPVEAELLIDGALVGTTPWKGDVLAEIEHELVVRLGKETSASTKVRLEPGAEVRRSLEVPASWAGATATVELELGAGPWELRAAGTSIPSRGSVALRPGRVPLTFAYGGELLGQGVLVASPTEHHVIRVLERPLTAQEREGARIASTWRRWIAVGLSATAGVLGAQQLTAAHAAEAARDESLSLLGSAPDAAAQDALREAVIRNEDSRAFSQTLGFALLSGAGVLAGWAILEWLFGEPASGTLRVEGVELEVPAR